MTLLAYLLMMLIGPGFYLSLCCLWASWMALGRTPLLVRMPVFLVGTLPLGFAFCVYDTRAEMGLVYGFLFVFMPALTAAIGQPRYYIGAAAGSLLGIYWGMQGLWGQQINLYWFCTIPLALCLLAAMISVVRLMGFRLIRFSLAATDQEIEQSTGYRLNEWINRLDRMGALQWSFANILVYLRTFGIRYEMQKAIAVAYEESLGRRSVDRSSDGRLQQVTRHALWSSEYWQDRWGRNRFTVAQTLCWCVAAASLFAFFRHFSSIELTANACLVGGPFLIVMAILSVSLLYTVLAIRKPLLRISLPISVLVIAIVLLPMMIGNYGLGVVGVWVEYFALMVAAMGGTAAWMTAALFLFQSQGYRLVRLQTVTPEPSARPPSHAAAATND